MENILWPMNAFESSKDFVSFEPEEEEFDYTPKRKTRKITSRRISEFLDGDAPWKSDSPYSSCSIRRLHEEIQDFCNYIQPTDEEIQQRQWLVNSLTDLASQLFPGSEIKLFGSCVTGLALPTSDIDMVLLTGDNSNPVQTLRKFSRAISKKKMSIRGTLQVISKTKVPIIKFTDKKHNIKVDICCNYENGPEAIEMINELQATPGVTELVLVVKQYLAQRELNVVNNGGVGSLSVLLMVSNFINMHPYIQADWIDPRDNLGVLLVDFLELFGRNLNYEQVGISYNGYFNKQSEENAHYKGFLSICDPKDPSNDIARSSFGIHAVKQSFEHAFFVLTSALYENNGQIFGEGSILSAIIQMPKFIQ